MSFKYQAVKHSNDHYVLAKCGQMKCDIHAYLSDDLYASSEEETWKQATNSASHEGVTAVYLMPDCHAAYGVPVGCVIVTDNVLIQAASGYDINCGVLFAKLKGARANALKSKYDRGRWVREVEKRIATGVGRKRPELMKGLKSSDIDEVLRSGAKFLDTDADLCERQFIEIPDTIDLKHVQRAYDCVSDQYGSVGGGNHFVELQLDRDDGSAWVMVHCGSRGYGWQTANHFFFEGARLRGIPTAQRESSWLYADEDLGKKYWAHHNSAANFAIANRHAIVNGLQDATQEVFNADLEVYYEISHNLVQEETLVLPDGSTKRGFVHRKGATRAMPAGHPDLVGTAWYETGHPVCIPGSMYDGAAIMFPRAGAHASACTVNHGSGRIMARGHAKKTLAHKQQYINEEMNKVIRTFNGVQVEGILSNHRHIPLDECKHVYKDLDEVIGVLERSNIAKVERRLFPVANIKGAD